MYKICIVVWLGSLFETHWHVSMSDSYNYICPFIVYIYIYLTLPFLCPPPLSGN